MSTNEQHIDNITPDAAAYALGLLAPEEFAAFHALVDAGAVDAAEVRDMVDVVTRLSEVRAAQMPAPRPSLRAAVLARAAGEPPRQIVVRKDDDTWRPMAPGIDMKQLFFDARSGTHTVLARLAPGASYPIHRHVGDEQCLVLQGELITDGVHLRGGDFIFTAEGTVHTDTHSDVGCLLLLATRMQDEILA